MTQPISDAANAKNITSTTTIFTGSCGLVGIFCSSSSSGTIKISDGSTTLVNTFSVTASNYYKIPAAINTSLIITVGGTTDCCVFWNASG